MGFEKWEGEERGFWGLRSGEEVEDSFLLTVFRIRAPPPLSNSFLLWKVPSRVHDDAFFSRHNVNDKCIHR